MDTLRQLKYLDVLATTGNVGAAADKLGVDKSTLSHAVSRLEYVYGVPLFVRDRQGIRPTVYGELLVDAARKGARIFDDVRREFALMRNLESGTLVIGSDPATTEALLAPALAQIVSEFPKLHFELREATWPDLEPDMLERRIDLYIGLKPDHSLKAFEVVDLELPPKIIYSRSGHPLSGRGPIPMAEAYNYPVMGTRIPDWYIRRVAEATASQDLSANTIREAFLFADDVSLMRRIVQHSDALSATFRTNLEADLESGHLVELKIKEESMNLPLPGVIVRTRNRLLPPSAEMLTEAVEALAESMLRKHET
ncbi:MAG: LysR family transcriptional regulator [Gammaproteobacteria bacterium]|nr:LysR family transcriptional regulator [Gammaproteobacteria bacterium]MYK81805.1 LysR family transcriptional regulator [Gammaproteobacteria bacterium]